jgi:hypothetical protein
MSRKHPFIDLCLAGQVLLEEIGDFVDEWHSEPRGKELHEHLGMTQEEYSLWVRMPDALPYILKARRENKRLTDTIVTAYQDMRLAARSNDHSKIARLQRWLKLQGELD